MAKNLGNFGQPDAWLFDLDNTLYVPQTGLFEQVRARIGLYLREVLGFAEDEGQRMQLRYRAEHGSTLAGLMREYHADPYDFLEFVHDVDYTVVKHDEILASALRALPGRKFIFTNGTAAHARKVTDRLDITDLFLGVFDIADADFVPKPNPAPYGAVVERYGLAPGQTALVEDMPQNLKPAKALGMLTVLVTGTTQTDGSEGADAVTDNLARWLMERIGARD